MCCKIRGDTRTTPADQNAATAYKSNDARPLISLGIKVSHVHKVGQCRRQLELSQPGAPAPRHVRAVDHHRNHRGDRHRVSLGSVGLCLALWIRAKTVVSRGARQRRHLERLPIAPTTRADRVVEVLCRTGGALVFESGGTG